MRSYMNMYVCVERTGSSETYRIPPGTGPGLLPNRQRFGIDLLDLLALRDREERIDDRTWIVAIDRKDVGLIFQEGLRELLHRLGDGGGNLFVCLEDPASTSVIDGFSVDQ